MKPITEQAREKFNFPLKYDKLRQMICQNDGTAIVQIHFPGTYTTDQSKRDEVGVLIHEMLNLAGASAMRESEREYAKGFAEWMDINTHYKPIDSITYTLYDGRTGNLDQLLSLYDTHLQSLKTKV